MSFRKLHGSFMLCCVAVLAFVFGGYVATADDKPSESKVSVVANAELPRDPNNQYGQLENGMKYIVRKHANPPGRVAVFMHVKTGALNETDKQNGLAHFLEHLGFNGSKNFAPGTLIPYLNKMGMTFGAHTNAHTNFQETVYKLFMPNAEDETVDKALTIMADYANGLLLLPEEIDKERGVVLEEERSGKSAAQRIQDQFRAKVFEGTRVAVHDVIGDAEQIKVFSQADFLDYWNTWYRPENVTLIVVGDLDPRGVIEKTQKHFADFKARAPERERGRGEIKPVEKVRAFVLTDPEQVMGQVQLLAIKEARPPMKTYQDYRFNEVENIGTWIVSRRLNEMVQRGEAAFRSASLGVNNFVNEAVLPLGFAIGEPADWNKMLEQVVVETSRAIEHGFAEYEFELAKKELLADAERAVETEGTWDAARFVGMYSSAIGLEYPILSAAQRLELVKKILSELSLAEVYQVFVENFKTPHYAYVLTMPEKKEGLVLPTSEEVLAAAQEAWARKTEAVKEQSLVTSILESEPTPGKVVSQGTDPDLNITTVKFENGVVMHHRFSDYKKEEVLVSINFAGGMIEETAENKGVSQVASLVNATSRLTSTQIQDFMTGKKVGVNGGVGLDTTTLSISGSPADLETGFQLAYAMMTDARIEQSAFDKWKQATLQQLEMMKTMPQGQLQMVMSEVYYGGDARFAMLTPEQVEKLNVKQGEEWIRRITASSPIEVAVVGDIPLDKALDLVTRHVGALPQRSLGYEGLDSFRKISRGAGPFAKTVEFDSITPKAIALAGFVGCEESNVLDRRLLALASRVLSDRMIKRIREEEQLVYGIGCRNQPGKAIPGLGMIMAAAPTDPANANRLADTILEMMREFAANGPTDEEVEIAKKQIINDLEKNMKEPSFWLSFLSEMVYRGKSLNELKELPAVYNTFTRQQIHEVAQKYFKDDQAIRFAAIPRAAATEPPAAEEKKEVPAGTGG